MGFLHSIRSKGPAGAISAVRARILKPFTPFDVRNFTPSKDTPKFVPTSDLEVAFSNKTGNQVHKWVHYLEIYERYLDRFRGTDFNLLEIGVFRGGSLELWRQHFGDKANIFGIDIDPNCEKFDGVAGQVRIGSQADPEFLKSVVQEMGGVDVVIDDGSHNSVHIKRSFDLLFPLLPEGGIYIVEDLHCAFWPAYSGGYRWPWSFINQTKRMIDDMHHWYHRKGQKNASTRDCLKAIHVYDSIIVFEKGAMQQPMEMIVPAEGK